MLLIIAAVNIFIEFILCKVLFLSMCLKIILNCDKNIKCTILIIFKCTVQ